MKTINTYSIYILLLFHLIGFALFLADKNNAELSYLNILVCGILIFLSEKHSIKSIVVLISIILGGFIIELIGVQTGLLFGNYAYGNSLGLKLFDVPLVIGINWYCVVASSSTIANYVRIHRIIQATIAGALSTLLDFVIEPIAIHFDFWDWSSDDIPLFNYICWFGFSSLFAFLYLGTQKSRNHTAFGLWFIWFLFFTVLSFIK